MGTERTADNPPYNSPIRRRHRVSRPHWGPFSITSETKRVLPIVLPVSLAGLATTVAAVLELIAHPPSGSAWVGIATLLVASTAAEAFPLRIESVITGSTRRTSLSDVFIVATAVIYGWAAAAVLGLLSMALVEMGRRRPSEQIAFNTGLYVCCALAAGGVSASVTTNGIGMLVVRAFLSAAAFYIVNILLLAAVLSRSRGTSFLRLAPGHIVSTSLPFLVLASVSTTIVVLWDRSAFLSVLIVGPVVMITLYERWLHGALERLREFDRLKDEFIAVISHELRTPLTSVYGAAVTLQKHQVQDEMRESLLAIVSEEAGRLARLLDDALSASRLHADKERFHIVSTELANVVHSVAEATRSRLPEGFALEVVAPPELPWVLADPDKLRQVLVNLLENAIKYSPNGGLIRLTAADAGSVVRFAVRDQGIGIPKPAQAHIFERFHRVDPNMTRGVGGTGLGLYICREIVERMNGRIWVESEEGAGSTFTFELPKAISLP